MSETKAGKLTDAEIKEYKTMFASFDSDGDGFITSDELTQVLKNLKMYSNPAQVSALIKEVDKNNNGTIEYHEFLDVINAVKSGSSSWTRVYSEQAKILKVAGHTGTHSYSEEEMAAFAEHLNNSLGHDTDLKYLMPIDPKGLDLCTKVSDGVLLAKFINLAQKDTIDERALNKRKGDKALSAFQINENLNLVVSAAKSIGVQTTNLGAAELIDGTKHPHMVLGLTWQLVKIHLLSAINLKNHPELIRLLEAGEDLKDLLRLPADQLLLRWFNYHLKKSDYGKRVNNFSGDVKDGNAYTHLLNQIAPGKCGKEGLAMDVPSRAARVIESAKGLGVRSFIQPRDITSGNSRLNLAFTAAIFNQCPGLDPISKEEIEKAGLMEDDVGDSREERAFRLWINSLNIPDLYLNNLFEDCCDGIALLKTMDKIQPKLVNWKSVEHTPKTKFHRVSNCNYVVLLGRQVKFSLVGIGGVDIEAKNKKLVLAIVWQMMRWHTLKFLAEVNSKKFGGKDVTDEMLVDWANATVAGAKRTSKMASFKDPSLATGVFYMDLLAAINPEIINWEYVKPGATPEDQLLNAKYAISVARKLGAVVFCLPEDLVEVRPKMTLTFIASCLSLIK